MYPISGCFKTSLLLNYIVNSEHKLSNFIINNLVSHAYQYHIDCIIKWYHHKNEC